MIAALVALALATTPTTVLQVTEQDLAGDKGVAFQTVADMDPDKVVALCNAALDAAGDGDTEWLARYYAGEPKTPPLQQLIIAKVCIAHAHGVLKGIEMQEARGRK